LLEGGIEFTVAVTEPEVVVVELQAARKASRPSAPAPANRAERCKKLLRLREDPKSGSAPIKDLLEKKVFRFDSSAADREIGETRVTFTQSL
jgi:hypothetical protein